MASLAWRWAWTVLFATAPACAQSLWVQQGPGIIQPGVFAPVALSADGNTAVTGYLPPEERNTPVGGGMVFSRSGHVWQVEQQLVPAGAIGQAQVGQAVAISGDGNTVALGGYNDNNVGAVWVFTRTGGGWKLQAKLSQAEAPGAGQGASVAPRGCKEWGKRLSS